MGIFKDLTGQQFGDLTVLSLSHCILKTRSSVWLCKCRCGVEVTVQAGNLVSGNTARCLSCSTARKVKDLIGRRLGRLVVIALVGKMSGVKNRHMFWWCKCDCGKELLVDGVNLRSGTTKSCGCYNDERRIEVHTTHGLSKTPIERTYRSMLIRCYKEEDKSFKDYGGRGIYVCDGWRGKDGLKNFAEDMGERPEGTQIDRIDNNGPYSPENCRWATNKENCRNKRSTKFITFNGKTQSLPDWAEELNIHYKALWSRVDRWGVERAFTEAIHTSQQRDRNEKPL